MTSHAITTMAQTIDLLLDRQTTPEQSQRLLAGLQQVGLAVDAIVAAQANSTAVGTLAQDWVIECAATLRDDNAEAAAQQEAIADLMQIARSLQRYESRATGGPVP